MNVSPRQLRMFLALAQSLNFSQAAAQLHMTQPSLSKAIQDLEAELGLPLFERSTRSVRLTPGGARMAAVARSVLGAYEAGLQRFESLAEREAQQLSIAAWPSLAHAVLPQVCAALEKQFAGAQVALHDGANSACIERLRLHQADFALATVSPSDPELQCQELVRDRFVLLASGKWRKRVRPRMRLEELLALPLITLTNASTAMRYMSAAFLQRGIEYQPKMQVDQVGTLAGLLAHEVGVAVLPFLGTLALPRVGGLQACEIVDGPLRSVGLVTRRLGQPSGIALAAMQQVQAIGEQLVARQPGWVLPPASRTA